MAAFAALLVIVFARAPMRQIPDALFVSDGFGYYIYLPSLVIDHDLDLSNQLGRVPFEASKSYFDRIEATGLRANPFPIGPAVLWLPFFLAAHAAVTVLRMFGAPIAATGFGYAYELPTYCGAFLYGVAGLWLLHRTISEIFSRRIGELTFLAMLLGTPYAYYLWIEPDVSHVAAAFSVALFLYRVWRIMRDRPAGLTPWVLLGVSLGIVALVRPYNGLIAAATLPAVWYVSRARDAALPFMIVRLAVCAAVALAVFVPQVAVATVLYGKVTFLPPGTMYDRMAWTHPNVLALAISTFSYFPLLLAAFVGLFIVQRPRRGESSAADSATGVFVRWVRPAALFALLIVLYITASYPRGSSFGDSFGQRRIVDWVPLLAVGFGCCLAALSFGRERRWTTIATAVVALCAVGAVLTGLYTLKLLPEWGMAGLLLGS